QMGPIYFPVPFEAISAQMTFDHLHEGAWTGGGVNVSTLRFCHPSFAVGCRLTSAGRSLCYIPDNELVGGAWNLVRDWRQRLVRFCGGTDLLVHDAMFTEEEYASRQGWGHST